MPTTYKNGAIKATLTDSLASFLRYDAFKERAPVIADTEQAKNSRDGFLLVAAHSENVKGIDWQPPSMFATNEDLRESMEQFFSQVDLVPFNHWMAAIGKLFESSAPAEEQGADEENPTTAPPGD